MVDLRYDMRACCLLSVNVELARATDARLLFGLVEAPDRSTASQVAPTRSMPSAATPDLSAWSATPDAPRTMDSEYGLRFCDRRPRGRAVRGRWRPSRHPTPPRRRPRDPEFFGQMFEGAPEVTICEGSGWNEW